MPTALPTPSGVMKSAVSILRLSASSRCSAVFSKRADDDHPGAAQVAVLSWAAWKNYFNGDPAIIGKTVRLNKQPYTVIGVTPQGFYGTEKFLQPDVFVPMSNEAEIEKFNWLEGRNNHNIWAIARIKQGVNLAQVQADLNTVASRIIKQFPKEEEGLSIRVVRPGLLGDTFGAPARAFLAGIMALAGIVLLAACANLGGLFAARTADRTRELAIRMAIGSSRWRILRQVLTEAFLIAFAGRPRCLCAWLGRTVRSRRLAAADRFPHSVRSSAAAIIDPRRRPVLICSRRTLRPHAIASNLESGSKRRHQKRCWSIERRAPLGPPRHPSRRPDRSLLHHRHRCFRRSARSGQIAQHGTRFQTCECSAGAI